MQQTQIKEIVVVDPKNQVLERIAARADMELEYLHEDEPTIPASRLQAFALTILSEVEAAHG